jgi:hypothetical protein
MIVSGAAGLVGTGAAGYWPARLPWERSYRGWKYQLNLGVGIQLFNSNEHGCMTS